MKKIGVLLLMLLVISIFTSVLVHAQEIPPLPGEIEKIQEASEKLTDVGESLTDEEQRSQYFEREWSETFDFLKTFNPAFKFLIGIEYSLSWLFFLSLGAWIGVVVLIYNPAKTIFQVNNWIALAIAVIIPTIAAQFGIIEMIVNFFIPLLTNKWIIFTFIAVIIILLYAYSLLMKKYGKTIREGLKEEREERRERKAKTVEKIHDIEIKAIKGK